MSNRVASVKGLLSFSGSSLLLCLWLDSSCYLSLEAVCCCACDLIHLVIFLWKQFVVVSVTWFILLSFSGSSLLLCLWLDSSCYFSLEAVCCCACDLILLVIFLWKQFVVVPVTWFILLSFSGSSLLLCLWLDSSCYLSMELSCWSSCLHLLLSNLSRETLCRLCPGLTIWMFFSKKQFFVSRTSFIQSNGTIPITCEKCCQKHVVELRLWFLMPFSTIFQLNRGGQFYVEETRVPRENHWPVASHWQTLSHNVSSTPCLYGNRTHNVSSDRHWLHS